VYRKCSSVLWIFQILGKGRQVVGAIFKLVAHYIDLMIPPPEISQQIAQHPPHMGGRSFAPTAAYHYSIYRIGFIHGCPQCDGRSNAFTNDEQRKTRM